MAKRQRTRSKAKSNQSNFAVHKFYLLIALFSGIILSIFMPFYSEPDGQYHFMTSAAMVGVQPDLSRYGEVDIGSGLNAQAFFYKNESRFQEYYQNEVVALDKKDIPRDLGLESKFNYNYVGHLIPALGTWLGYKLSPTLGMMITIARLFSMFCYSLMMFFIIRFLKSAQLFFTTIALSPVILNSFSSYSYDSFGFVAVAFILMICINAITSKKFTFIETIALIISLPLFLLGVKPNLYLVLLVIPMSLIYCYKQEDLTSFIYQFGRNRKAKKSDKATLVIVALILLVGFFTLVVLTSNHGGIFSVLKRLSFTFSFRFYASDSPGDLVNLLASPYPTINYMPSIITAVWFLLVSFVLLSEKAYHDSKWLSIGAASSFLLGILSVYVGFLGYGAPLELGFQNTIQGVQGRYLTPLLLLLSPVFSSVKHESLFNKIERKKMFLTIAAVSVISSFLLVSNTLYAVANL